MALGDHDVPLLGDELAGKRVALMVCGGIAAMKTPLVARALRRRGAAVTAFVSKSALLYVTEDSLAWSTDRPVVRQLTPNAEHLSDSAPFDAYLLPQATYNTINKLAAGIADGVLTSTLASALGRMTHGEAQVLVVPTMHGTMHNPILTASLRRLDELGVRVVRPRQAYGKHNIPNEPTLVAEVCRAVADSPLVGRRVVVTGGTPAIRQEEGDLRTRAGDDDLGIAVAEHLYLRGADVLLLQAGAQPVPEPVPHQRIDLFDAQRAAVRRTLDEAPTLGLVLAAREPGHDAPDARAFAAACCAETPGLAALVRHAAGGEQGADANALEATFEGHHDDWRLRGRGDVTQCDRTTLLRSIGERLATVAGQG